MASELNILPPEIEVASKYDAEKDQRQKSSTDSPTKGVKDAWKSAYLLLVNQALVTLAFFGVGVNLVIFLTRVLEYDTAQAANNISNWTGTVYLFSLVGAFLADSYWGRYLTSIVFQVIFLAGLVLLSLATWLFLIKPTGCGDKKLECSSATIIGSVVFYISVYLVALGYGGYQPTLATFGSDQFDESDSAGFHAKALFFGYFYFALNAGSLFSNTILAYYEDRGYWTVGFMASAGSAALGLLLFCGGTRGYRYVKPCGNPLTRVAQVFVATFKKRNVTPPSDGSSLFELEGSESAIKGSRKIQHSEQLRFLDKAATLTEKDLDTRPNYNPWRLCTITQVEEVKCVMKMLPIWLCTIMYSVIFTQMASLFVQQGAVMNCQAGSFELPPASMSAIDIMSVLVFTMVYQHFIIPIAARFTGNPKGISELQRMGIGLVVGMLAMISAGVTEVFRRKYAIPGTESSSLSIFWQTPQFMFVGMSEVLMYVGQLDFFNGQAPDGLKSFGSSLCMASMSLGNYFSTILVNVVTFVTTRGGNPGWIPVDLNIGHLDHFYFLIATFAGIDLVLYVYFAKRYRPINLESVRGWELDDHNDDDNDDDGKDSLV